MIMLHSKHASTKRSEIKKMQVDENGPGPKMPRLDLDRKLLHSKSCISKHAINLKPRRSFTPTSPKSAANFLSPFCETREFPLLESTLRNIKLFDSKDISYYTPTSKSSPSYTLMNLPTSSSPPSIKLPDFSKNIDDFDVRPILLNPRVKRCIRTHMTVPSIVQRTPTTDDTQIHVSSEYAYETPNVTVL